MKIVDIAADDDAVYSCQCGEAKTVTKVNVVGKFPSWLCYCYYNSATTDFKNIF